MSDKVNVSNSRPWFNGLSASSIMRSASLSGSRFIDLDDIKGVSNGLRDTFLDKIGSQFAMDGLKDMIDASDEVSSYANPSFNSKPSTSLKM